MSLISNIKKSFALTAVLFLFTACGGGGGSESSSVSTTNGIPLDTSGETTTSTSTPESSTLKVVAVQINEPIITKNSITLEWTPNGYTTKLVEYGTSKKYGSELLVNDEDTITLLNLQANTTYHYRIVQEDKNGRKVVSRDNTFTTLGQSTQPIVTEAAPAEPIITEPIVTEPEPTEPTVTEPEPTEPIVTEPAPTEPIVAEPIVTEPAPTEPIVTEPISEPQVPVCQSGTAQQLGQIKDSISSAGLIDVTVTIAGCFTKTDANGFYTLNNIVVNDKAVVNFEKEGYALSSTTIQIKELSGDNTTSLNYLEYSMYAYSNKWDNGREWSYESQNGATGGAVEIPANSIHTDPSGNVYNGTVTARWVFKDTMTAEGRDAFPGSFQGINTNGILVPFVSYGLTSLELENENGESLNLQEDIILVLPSITGTTQSIIPLWYYDYAQGLWFEEGYAERQTDGTYRANISHTGTWSLSQPIEEEVGIYRGSIVNVDGSPLSNVRLKAIGDNWISNDLSTDENGIFEIEVIPGSSFKLAAYDYKNKYGANYNGIISAIASGDIVEN